MRAHHRGTIAMLPTTLTDEGVENTRADKDLAACAHDGRPGMHCMAFGMCISPHHCRPIRIHVVV